MKKFSIVLAIFGYASTARLDHLQYLPPNTPQGPAPPNHHQQPQFPTSGKSPSVHFDQQSGTQYQPSSSPHYQPSETHHQSSGAQFSQGPTGAYGGSTGPSGPGNQQYSPQQYSGPRSELNDVPILKLDSDNAGDGTYRYAYETGNGIAAQEEGDSRSGWTKARGSFAFTSPEGQNFELTYTADENGYQPQGAHLPTPPPIPEAILKSLEVIRQAEDQRGYQEGQYEDQNGDYHGHDNSYHGDVMFNKAPVHGSGQNGYQSGPAQGAHGSQGTKSGSFGQEQGFRGSGLQGQQGQHVASNGGYRY